MKITPPGMTPAPSRGLFTSTESKRMRWLLFTFLLVVAALVFLLRRENERQRQEAEQARIEQEREPGVQSIQVTPEIDVERLRALVRDRTPEERVLVDPTALSQALRETMLVGDQLFAPMGGRLLTPEEGQALMRDPDPARGQLLRAHGWVDEAVTYEAVGQLPAHTRGRLRLEQGGWAYFAVLRPPESGLVQGDFVRVDGIFLALFRREGDVPGGWVDAPLLVGPRGVGSFPRMEAVRELDPQRFTGVQDDSIANGITGQPFFPYWELVSYVRNLEPGDVDWSQAPVLDRETMAELALDGSRFRAQPVRLPLSQIMDSWIQAQKDNPLRIERLTEGWIGNETWFGPTNGVIRYVSPHLFEGVRRKDDVLANGFFLKHLAYEPSKGGVAIAPFFVLNEMETYTPVIDPTWRRLLIGFGAGVVLLGVGIFALLRRDRRRSAQLQEELLARRRARRRAQVTS